jgi:hypothetical protein
MKAKRLKEILNNIDDDTEVFIRNSVNVCGNIQELEQIELSTYGFFGVPVPCIILNTPSSKDIEEDEAENYIDFLRKEGD